ncbi:unnamed protein product [Phaedon cochleariae]|uniref:Uncharacterized protein n=1 Tax=Phaedon cochleariae TaxID=80249 RepID=A0A9P0DSM3_PHACE|nr:unnamed protein product [Phaedon cochleariae]
MVMCSDPDYRHYSGKKRDYFRSTKDLKLKKQWIQIISSAKMKRRCRQCGQGCLLVTGIFLIATGVTIFICFESIYTGILSEALKFTPDSPTFKAWRTNDPPLIMEIFMFNWTNADQVYNSSVKPEFEEIGPYRFKEIKEKVYIRWHEHNHTVSFLTNHTYYFDYENSVRNLSDVITTINAVPLTVAYKARDFSYWAQKAISMGLSSISKLYVTKTVGELLFEGFEEPILSTLSKMPMLRVQDKFGIFYGRNGTVGQEGSFSMSYKTDENFGKIVTWNGRNRTDFYEGRCNEIRGSAGEFYPFDRPKDKLVLYSSQLCKYAELEYDQEVEVKGVRGYNYLADNIFDNGTTRPENSCFCSQGGCIPSGVFNVSTCRDGSPSFLSFPHFYAADPSYRAAMKGMRPDREKHQFYITMEPKSAIVMNIQATMQLNMLLQPIPNIRLYKNVPRIFVPIFYFTQSVRLTDEIAVSLRLIQNLPVYSNYFFYVLVGLGCISIVTALCSCFCCSKTEDYAVDDAEQKKTMYQLVPVKER